MSEQPPKFICELCGGQHSTNEHQKFITDRFSDGETFLETKNDKEALEKNLMRFVIRLKKNMEKDLIGLR